MDQASKKAAVERYIVFERGRRKINNVDRTIKTELSGLMQGGDGDIESLIERQLLTTEVGFGSWRELDDPYVLDAVYRLIGQRQHT